MNNGKITLARMERKIAPYGAKNRQTYLKYCRNNVIQASLIDKKWYVDNQFVDSALEWRTNAVYIEDLLKDLLAQEQLESKQWLADQRNLTRKISRYWQPDNEYSVLFAGSFINPSDIETVKDIIVNEIEIVFGKNDLINTSEACKILNISDFKLKQLVTNGTIRGKYINLNWFYSLKDINAYLASTSELIGVYDFTKEICTSLITNFDFNNRSDRYQLNAFLRHSELKDYLISRKESAILGDTRNTLYFDSRNREVFQKHISEFLINYRLNRLSLKNIFQEDYWCKNEITRKAIIDFSQSRSEASIVAICNSISLCIDEELSEANNNDITCILNEVSAYGIEQYKKDFIGFIRKYREAYDCKFTLDLAIESTKKKKSIKPTTLPYDYNQYFELGKLCFNEDSIKRNHLYEKAVQNSKLSYVWLFICMHYISAWRKGDIETNLPIIHINYNWEELKDKLCEKEFDEEAINYSLLIQKRINESNILPNKTKNKQRERFLVIDIPTSLRSVFGRVYSIYCKHNEESRINKNITYKDYFSLLGFDYFKLFGNYSLSNRRLNKSYLNFLSDIISHSGISSYSMSYRVASYARAHVEPDHQLSETTSKYLMHKMDGLSVDEVLVQLLENGICSFTVRYLLEIAYGEQFQQLGFKEQAALVNQMNLTAFKAEGIARVINDSFMRSKVLLDDLFRSFRTESAKKNHAALMLKTISSRQALTNIYGLSCIILATKKSCPYRYQRSCIGCQNSIQDLAFFLILVERINTAYLKIKKAKTEATKRLLQNQIEEELLPSAYEILFLAKSQFDYDISIYTEKLIEIIERRGIDVKTE